MSGERPFMVIVGLVLLLLAMSLLPHFAALFRQLAGHIEEVRLVVRGITVVSSLIFGLVILSLCFRAVSAAEGAGYMGAAFLVIFFQHLCYLALETKLVVLGPVARNAEFKQIGGPLFSVFVNVLYMAAGLKLLEFKAFPAWNWLPQAVGLAMSWGLLWVDKKLSQIPDALVSAYAMYWLGYALYRNVRYTNSHHTLPLRWLLGLAVLSSTVIYSIVGMMAALLPLFFDEKLAWMKLLGLCINIATLLLKLCLFGAFFYWLIGAIIFLSTHYASRIFEPITDGNGEFLANSGIPQSVVDAVGAASAFLYVKIPGQGYLKEDEEEYGVFKWPAPDNKLEKIDSAQLDPLVQKALKTGKLQRFPGPDGGGAWRYFYLPPFIADYFPSRIAVPVKFHNAVVGCLLVTNKGDQRFSPTAIQQIKDLATLSILAVQGNREQAALDQISFRFSRILARQEGKSFQAGVSEVVDVLYDVLNPLAIGIWVDVGLQEHVYLAGDEKHRLQLIALRGQVGDSFAPAPSPLLSRLLRRELLIRLTNNPEDPLYVVGELALLVPEECDPAERPILGRNKIHYRTVLTRTTSTIQGLLAECLNTELQKLSVQLNQPEMNTEKWFVALQDFARQAGFIWLVAQCPITPHWLGPESEKRVVRAAVKGEQANAHNDSELAAGTGTVDIEVLPHSQAELWFGVPYCKLKPLPDSEYTVIRDVSALWKPFMERLRLIADSSLGRILKAEEERLHLQNEAQLHHELATLAVTVGEIIHQVVNGVKDLEAPVSTLRDALLSGALPCTDAELRFLIESLPITTRQLLAMTADFRRLSEPKAEQECNLRQVAELSRSLFALTFTQRRIQLIIEVPDGLMIAVPPHVAALALVNLVSNAKDAIGFDGTIHIRAMALGNMIECMVIDSGPGVAPPLAARIFERGVTTKGAGGGWGLYLVKRSLAEHHGQIELTHPGLAPTTFTIRFPVRGRPLARSPEGL